MDNNVIDNCFLVHIFEFTTFSTTYLGKIRPYIQLLFATLLITKYQLGVKIVKIAPLIII